MSDFEREQLVKLFANRMGFWRTLGAYWLRFARVTLKTCMVISLLISIAVFWEVRHEGLQDIVLAELGTEFLFIIFALPVFSLFAFAHGADHYRLVKRAMQADLTAGEAIELRARVIMLQPERARIIGIWVGARDWRLNCEDRYVCVLREEHFREAGIDPNQMGREICLVLAFESRVTIKFEASGFPPIIEPLKPVPVIDLELSKDIPPPRVFKLPDQSEIDDA